MIYFPLILLIVTMAENGAQQFSKVYEVALHEQKIRDMWKENGYAKARKGTSGDVFSLTMPPQIVSQSFEIHQAFGATLQDAVVRYHRMKGDETVYIPGFDHGGMLTEIRMMKLLEKEGRKKSDLSKEEFIAYTTKKIEEQRKSIIASLDYAGYSCDLEKMQDTFSPEYTKAVQEAFISLYKKGIIYSDDNIVHWCSKTGTVLSDNEITKDEASAKLYYVRYFVKAADKSVVIVTHRPETLLGDVAVAVHPDDKRYKELHDKVLILPVCNKEIPIICDRRVDMHQGTGVVKITPAHDAYDFELAKEHNLPVISVIGKDGRMNKNAGKYAGLDVSQARNNIIEYLDNIGNLEKIEEARSFVYRCAVTGHDVEPLVMKQWFVRTKELLEHVEKALDKEDALMIPEKYEEIFREGMSHMKDWCISRQLYWGHAIPAWHNGEEIHVGIQPPKGEGWTMDPDVVDMWFSSALWSFASLGWPDASETVKKYFPTSAVVVSQDHLFDWVGHMMMLSSEIMKDVPFRYLYVHGTVKDTLMKKYSASKPNLVDDLIQTHGGDMLRLMFLQGMKDSGDSIFDEHQQESLKNFTAKLWNASRYIRMQEDQISSFEELEKMIMKNYQKLNFAQHWILSRLHSVVEEVTNGFEEFRFGSAHAKLFEFTWNEFCDWYLEISKIENNEFSPKILQYGILLLLKLWHPYIPCLTETIWSYFDQKEDLMVSTWPVAVDSLAQEEKEKDFALLIEVVKAIQHIRVERGVDGSKNIPVYVNPDNKEYLIDEFRDVMKKLAKLSEVSTTTTAPEGKFIHVEVAPFSLWIPLQDVVDIEKERFRLQEQLKDLEKTRIMVTAKLENPAFIENAPIEVVAHQKMKKQETEKLIDQLMKAIEDLG